MKIAIEKIQPSPEPVRKQMEPAKLDELAQSIREQGLIVPIKVRPTQNGKYEIVYGHRRFAAAQLAGLDEIEAWVDDDLDDVYLIMDQAITENAVREDMLDIELAEAMLLVKNGKNWSNTTLAKRYGMSVARVGQLFALLDRPDEVRKMLRREVDQVYPIGEWHVREVRRAELNNEEETRVLRKTAQEGLTAKQTRQVAEAVAATKDPRRQQQLIERPYDPLYHDKEWVEWRESRYGQADPELSPKHKRKDEDWRNLPEVRRALEFPKQAIELVETTRKMAHEGKLAPEAVSFVGRRWLKVIDHIEKLIDEFGVE